MPRLTILAFAFLSALSALSGHLHAADQPNLVVIMVDDLGYSDIGCYGGEIETPTLDRLATNGLRFSQFYNTAKCHSSRVSLLTGQYCIAAGDTTMTHAVTSAEVLRNAGYFTAMTGKWHLEKEPTDFGFSRYFGHLSGACNFFKGDNTFRLNGEPWKVPDTDFYTTVAKIDHALDFLKEARSTEKPFYLYVAFNAPHAPLHALPEDYAKYKGRYDAGWDKIRDARTAKLKHLGLLTADTEPSPRPPHVRAWDKLVPWQRDFEINRMVTLAAMIDRVDQEIGRLVKDLKKNGELENTLILFVSDNGACPYDRKAPQLGVSPTNGASALSDSTGWAWARNAPFRYYKQNQFEGGIGTPGIVHWPAGLKTKPGSIIDTPAHLIDVLPTLADLAGTKIPKTHPERELRPVSGISLRPILEDQALVREEPIHLQFASDYGLRDGDWKLVSFKGQEWELYNIAKDRTELNNLAAAEPDRLKAMVDKWKQMSLEVLHSNRLANPTIKPTQNPRTNREWTVFSDSETPPAARQKRRKRSSSASIRARKNTTMTRKDGALHLTFTGDDSGIAMDLRGEKTLPAGPYRIAFDLDTELAGTGEIFYTTDPKTSLPNGERIPFPLSPKVTIPIDTGAKLHQLRIDITDGTGKAILRNLQLTAADGKTLKHWTPVRTFAIEYELVILAGQSNAVGFDAKPSELPEDDADKRVLFWWKTGDPPPDEHDSTSASAWTTLSPQPLGTPAPKKSAPRQYGNFAQADGGFGPEIGFARALLKAKPDRKLAILKVAFSGTSLPGDWDPAKREAPQSCYAALLAEFDKADAAAKEKGIALKPTALLWVQGESDANPQNAPRYTDDLDAFISAIRKDLAAPDLLALLAVNTRFGMGKNPHMPAIVAAQKKVAESDARAAYIDTSRAPIANGAHFDTKGTLMVGQWFADAYSATPDPAPSVP